MQILCFCSLFIPEPSQEDSNKGLNKKRHYCSTGFAFIYGSKKWKQHFKPTGLSGKAGKRNAFIKSLHAKITLRTLAYTLIVK